MTLPNGTRLGPYEILGPLGAGGMGVVYRARDTRLGRDVAVKVLPAEFAEDLERLRRFEREARAAGRINDPNLLAIYDVGVHDGQPYLVAELLEGQTLRARLGGAALPVRKAVDYAIQLAHGLAAAHERGIVHRDLKPSNLFLTRDGRLKILDFGLAKFVPVRGDPPPVDDVSTTLGPGSGAGEGPPDRREPSPDASLLETAPGAILGTYCYMSPEQVQGLAVDSRSDLFAFGILLYEMLSGRCAFRRDTVGATFEAILREDPPPLADGDGRVSPALDRVVRRCLEKAPDERFQSARDLAFALEVVAGDGRVRPPGRPPVARWRRAGVALGLLAVLAVAAGAGAWIGRGSGPRPIRYQRMTFRRGAVHAARFAPDGQVVYAAAWEGRPCRIYATRPSVAALDPLGHLGPANLLAISHGGELAVALDPRWSSIWISRGTLARAPLAEGRPRPLRAEVRWADFAPDGQRLAIVTAAGGRDRLEYPEGTVLYESAGAISHPRVAPDGRAVAFLDHPKYNDNRGSVALVDTAGHVRPLTPEFKGVNGLAWAKGGREVWFSPVEADEAMDHAIYAVTLSGRQRVVSRMIGGLTLHDVAPDGRALVARKEWWVGTGALAPGAARERDLSWLEWTVPAALSADGSTLLFFECSDAFGSNYMTALRGLDGGDVMRLGPGEAQALSPDGRWALAILLQPESRLVLLPTGAGAVRRLAPGRLAGYDAAAWFPDGRRLLIAGHEPGRPPRCYVQALDGGAPRVVTPDGYRFPPATDPVAPDGSRFVAIGPDDQVAIIPAGGGRPESVAGLTPGDQPLRWGPDGRSLLVARQGALPAEVYRFDLAAGRKDRQPLRRILPADPAGVVAIGRVVLTPDARAYAYSYNRMIEELYVVDGLE